MRRRIGVFATTILFCTAILFAGCQPASAHTHSYAIMTVEDAYLAKAATCTEPAVYYYACRCGGHGTRAFTYGEVAPHTFTEKITTQEYLHNAATTREAAKYYYACSACQIRGTETFFWGEPLPDFPDAVGFMNYDYSITLDDTLPAGTYALKFENDTGTLSDYAEICRLKAGESYSGLILQNTAPQTATKIGVYDDAGARVGSVAFASDFQKSLGDKLYSFGAISDTHIGYKTAEDDLEKALSYFEKDASIAFVANCGDMATGGADANLKTYKSITERYTKTVYEIAGNHEASRGYLTIDGLKEYTGEDLYYTFTHGDDVYIMVGMWDVHAGEQISEEEMIWLYETLEANRDKRCFVFMHLNPRDGSGDAVDLDLAGDMLSNSRGETFYSLMDHYENVIWFHGHTHQKFETQELAAMNNYDNVLGSHSVHIPSLSVPRYADGEVLADDRAASEGYVVDVYENAIVLRGRDFVSGKFLPVATFCLDTTQKAIAENSFADNAQNIVNANSNVLKEADTWYEGSINRSAISRIVIETETVPEFYSESWDASISGSGQIMAYRDGTDLYLICKEQDILANKNSQNLFAGFTNLKKIEGLEKLNTKNVEEFASAFENCKNLEQLDLSSLNLQYVRNLRGLFKGCTMLQMVTLPENIGVNSIDGRMYILQGMFEECKKLTAVDVSMLLSQQANIGNMFKDCAALEEVSFGTLQIVAAANAFYNCARLKTLNLQNADFSECDTMLQMFRGCSILKLDCSGWDTGKCEDFTDFNTNAPGITPPASK